MHARPEFTQLGVVLQALAQEARLRLARFARMLPRMTTGRAEPLARADLRYTNGFALVWAQPEAAEAAADAGAAAPVGTPGNRVAVAPISHALRIQKHGLT